MLLGVGPLASYPLTSSGGGSIQFIEATLTSTGSIVAELEHFAGFIATTVSSGVMASAPTAAVPLCSNFAGVHNTSASLNASGTLVASVKVTNIVDGLMIVGGAVQASPIIARRVQATMVGRGTLSADALHRTPWTSDMFAFGTLEASISIRSPMNATLASVGTVNTNPIIIRRVAPTTLSGAGTLTASATVYKRASCFMVGTGTFRMTLGTNAEAQLIGKSSMFANATKIYADPIDAGSGFAMMPSVVKQTIKAI